MHTQNDSIKYFSTMGRPSPNGRRNSLRDSNSRTLQTPRGEFRPMDNGHVDFNGLDISMYGLAPLLKCGPDGQWHDQPPRWARGINQSSDPVPWRAQLGK
jgi:hypothetical protein